MALVVPDVAEIILLKYIINQKQPDDRILHLYTNNYVPSDSTTLANLTEADPATGYQSQVLNGATWSVTQTAGVTTATYPDVTFSFTTAVTIVGYYVTTLSNSLLWVEIFSNGPFALPAGGGQLAVTPTLTLD